MASRDSDDGLWPPFDGAPGCAGREPAAFELLARYHTAVLLRDVFLLLRVVHENPRVTFDPVFGELDRGSQGWIVGVLKHWSFSVRRPGA